MHPITLSFTVTVGTEYNVTIDANDVQQIRERRDTSRSGNPVVGSTVHFKSSETAPIVVNEAREHFVGMIVPSAAKLKPAKTSSKKDAKK